MKLIADSGSSKTEWRVIDRDGRIFQARTSGLNPYHIQDNVILSELREVLINSLTQDGLDAEEITEVYFYGSGCVPGEPSDRIKSCLSAVFPHAMAEVKDDLLAVARGLCGREAGVVAILGTGSNSGAYDGDTIKKKVTALGYILGDEGSGAWIGKELMAMYLRDELDADIKHRLTERFDLTREKILEKVYRAPNANRFLAGFSKFVFQHIKNPRLHRMVYDGFHQFMEKNILKYPESQSTPVHFSGSVAFYYANILRQVAADKSIRVGHVVEGPIAGLALYHKTSKSLT